MIEWSKLDGLIDGEVYDDAVHRKLYATDASIYRQLPAAVTFPKSVKDLSKIVKFCRENAISLIARGAGTSLAGQVVGAGLIVDTSLHMTKILEINAEERWVRCQPGVVRDELNQALESFGLVFGPNTSTSNRCVMGGMVGNNSCGTTSIYYGNTRDKLLSMEVVLSDGSITELGDSGTDDSNALMQRVLDWSECIQKTPHKSSAIESAFPPEELQRRNSGYALDELLREKPAAQCLHKILCGSEGTLALTSAVTLHLDPLPPKYSLLIGLEFDTVRKAMEAVIDVMKSEPYQCELIDDIILNCTKGHPTFGPYLDIFDTIPKAFLMVELRKEDEEDLVVLRKGWLEWQKRTERASRIQFFSGKQAEDLWTLRKAGLGLLANLPGEARAVACIEDTAVALKHLPNYIDEFDQLMQSFDQQPVYYAHAGAGELHLRPVLNLKEKDDRNKFEQICQASAELVLKYEGSISGEHGDGRVRAPFLEMMYGPEVYGWMREFKQLWDPDGIFNPGKIIDPEPILSDLRTHDQMDPLKPETPISFLEEGSWLAAAEKCNGSGDCRKSHLFGGAMCPSYHVTHREKDSTRGRANMLREAMTSGSLDQLVHEDVKDVLDLCVSCKACAGECPSKVDMSSMKANWLYHYYQHRRRPLRDWLFTWPLRSTLPSWLQNMGIRLLNIPPFRSLKSAIGLHPHRPLPLVSVEAQPKNRVWNGHEDVDVLIYADEFVRTWHVDVLQKACSLLEHLGYTVKTTVPVHSGRAEISKGMLNEAQKGLMEQMDLLNSVAQKRIPLIGLEPSTILTLKDEFPRMLNEPDRQALRPLQGLVHTFGSWWKREMDLGKMEIDRFVSSPIQAYIHAHCHFKALENEEDLYLGIASLPGVQVQKIPSGCCGMAGSFGYEKEHYSTSVSIAELKLIPAIKEMSEDDVLIAHGTSCRHQITDLTQRKAIHPVEFIYSRLKKK